MWARFDDGYYDNPKILRAGRWARELHMVSVIWVAGHANQTGRIPMAALRLLGDKAEIPRNRLVGLSQILEREHLWEPGAEFWLLHDWRTYLPKTDAEKREAAQAAGRLGGLAKAAQRRSGDISDIPASYIQDADASEDINERSSADAPPEPNANQSHFEYKTRSTARGILNTKRAQPPPLPSPTNIATVLSLETLVASEDARVSDLNLAVFIAWQNCTGHLGAHLLPRRRQLMADRRREGYTQDDLLDAVRGWQNDPWTNRKENNDLKYLLKDGTTVEKFRDYWRQGKPLPEMVKPNGATQRGQAWGQLASRLKEEGR